jgi:murein DD-endopeptidase MepM/ murein hydrolase activator NlpD
MNTGRFTIVVADRSSGEVRLTLPVRRLAVALCSAFVLPILIGLGAAWKAKIDVASLEASHAALEVENASYRKATESLAGQIHSLQSAVTDLGTKSLDPKEARAVDKLPAVVKSRAMGGSTEVERAARTALANMPRPEDTFGLLHMLLQALESRLHVVRTAVDKRHALAAATPSIWPAHGWLSSTVGMRNDPMTGASEFHSGLDIAGDKGAPVYATATGRVSFAGYQGGYGKLVVIDHGFGLQSRYGHLSDFLVRAGAEVKRGEQIGKVGATGRATGAHLHYEVLANGRLLNPLQLLTQTPRNR